MVVGWDNPIPRVPYTNHVASVGRGVKEMYMFVYVGVEGGLTKVYIAFFTLIFQNSTKKYKFNV